MLPRLHRKGGGGRVVVLLESVEQKPNHFRRLRPLGCRDADVCWRILFLLLVDCAYLTLSLVMHTHTHTQPSLSLLMLLLLLCTADTPVWNLTQNRPQIYCLASTRSEAILLSSSVANDVSREREVVLIYYYDVMPFLDDIHLRLAKDDILCK